MNPVTMHRIKLQPAYVLHQRPYRDTSRIVELFTREHGRFTVFVRGVRNRKTGLAAVLQSFQPLLISWTSKGEAGQLEAAEIMGEPRSLPPKSLLSGFYLNELLLKLLHIHDPQIDVFDLYNMTIERLKSEHQESQILRIFEKRLLRALGFGLSLIREAESGFPIMADRSYRYVLEQGPLPILADVDPVKGVYSGATLLALEMEEFSTSQQCNEARYLLRSVLDHVLDGRHLQSREILTSLRQMRSTKLGF